MGWWIGRLDRLAEGWTGDRPARLRLAGAVITLLLVGGSFLLGWAIEALARPVALARLVLVVALASALAGRSLEQAVRAVLRPLAAGAGGLEEARARLAWIVGRDVEGLDREAILRAAAETAAENGVDGVFAPLFWMLLGAAVQLALGGGPGPLAFAWAFKAASTLDSMLGYRRGRLRWLGTAGARLDDLLTWIPCRLVALSLPLVAERSGPRRLAASFRLALRQGRPDPSPNAGVSQAAYALAARVRLGGLNRYGGVMRAKPVLGAPFPPADGAAVERILGLTRRLERLWLAAGLVLLIATGSAAQ
jgi:adenosylcobinamide-phosphate synthase